MGQESVEVSEHIEATPAALYALVSDLPRMGEWSPENTGGSWKDASQAGHPGASFKGSNKSGWRRWSTSVTVTEAQQGKRFAFAVTHTGVPIAGWSFEFAPSGTGTTVTERWEDHRPGWMAQLSKPVMGVSDRAGHNRTNMQQTLSALKRAAEGGAPHS